MSLAAMLARLFLAAALLAGWQAALEHPVTHHDDRGGFVHGPKGTGTSGDTQCDAIAAVATVVGGASVPTVPVLATANAVPQVFESNFASATALAYRSQAPPQHS
jgi:hypothetical protein